MTPIPQGGGPAEARRRYGLETQPFVDFSNFVNPYGPSRAVVDAARTGLERVGTFPEPGCPRLVERIAERHGVPVDRVIVGAGASELISLIGQSFLDAYALLKDPAYLDVARGIGEHYAKDIPRTEFPDSLCFAYTPGRWSDRSKVHNASMLAAAFLVGSLPIDVLRWVVVFVVLYAAAMMLRSARNAG